MVKRIRDPQVEAVNKIAKMIKLNPDAELDDVSLERDMWGEWKIWITGKVSESVARTVIFFCLPVAGPKTLHLNNKKIDLTENIGLT